MILHSLCAHAELVADWPIGQISLGQVPFLVLKGCK